MPINKNHEFEDLNGQKCSIVERNASAERIAFLQDLLVANGFEVIVIDTPQPKPAPVAKPAVKALEGEEAITTQPAPPEMPVVPITFTIGVTDVMFNPVNAVFGRLLRTKTGRVVTLAYWEQKEQEANDEIPYFEKT